MKLRLLVFLFSALSVFAQGVVTDFPFGLINDDVADTWQPGLCPGGGTGRFTCVVNRDLGGVASAQADFNFMVANPVGFNGGVDNDIQVYIYEGMKYLVYHKSGNDPTANPYCSNLWNHITGSDGVGSLVYPVTQAVVTGGGSPTMTVTLGATPSPALTVGQGLAFWGATSGSNPDALSQGTTACSGECLVITSITSPTVFTVAVVPGTPAGTYTDPTMIIATGVAGIGQSWTGLMDENGNKGSRASQTVYFWNACHDWLVANGHDQYIKDNLRAAWWNMNIARQSSGFSSNVRESDFHNHASYDMAAFIELGVSVANIDPTLGPIAFAAAKALLFQGYSVIPVSGQNESVSYNLSASFNTITQGACNWEGPGYLRVGCSNLVRAIEFFDTATNRYYDVWHNYFPNSIKAGYYEIYTIRPDGYMAIFGDTTSTITKSGKDNVGVVVINDRNPDPHFPYFMDHSVGDPWNVGGSGGEAGMGLKNIFYPYTGLTPHDYTDLPQCKQLGPDIICREWSTANGISTSDRMYTYTDSVGGTYHRQPTAGEVTLFGNGSQLIAAVPDFTAAAMYLQYKQTNLSGNTMTVYDPSDCWTNEIGVCGQGSDSDPTQILITNSSGQHLTERRRSPQFNAPNNQPNPAASGTTLRIWSGSLYSDNRAYPGTPYTGETYASLYGNSTPLNRTLFGTGTNYESASSDYTSRYVNQYDIGGGTGLNTNPTVKINSAGGAQFKWVRFHPTQGTQIPIVTFQRIESTNASLQKALHFHMIGAPTVNGVLRSPGDTTAAGTVTSTDSGSGRGFIQHLLPASPNVRSLGGNNCSNIALVSCSNANPSVCTTATPHGLVQNETIEIDTGSLYYGVYNGGGNLPSVTPWGIDLGYGANRADPGPPNVTLRTGNIISPTQFELQYWDYGNTVWSNADGTSVIPWSTQFQTGSGPPVGTAGQTGLLYYDQTSVNGVWMSDFSNNWHQLSTTTAGYPLGMNFTGPRITGHGKCNWYAYVDQYGPTGSPGEHLWTSEADGDLFALKYLLPQWEIQEEPSSASTVDYFLNVLTSDSTSVSSPPTANLISGAGYYGALITGATGYWVATFSTATTPQTTLTYTATHSGSAQHVVAGLAPGLSYVVKQGGSTLTTVASDTSGAIGFTETGGGTFSLLGQAPASLSVGAAKTVGGVIVH